MSKTIILDRVPLGGTFTLDGVRFVKLDGDHDATFSVAEGIPVTQDGATISVYTLKPDYKVSLVVNGSTVVSIQVDRVPSDINQVTGTVLMTDTTQEIMTIALDNGSPLRVDVARARFTMADGTDTDLEYIQTNTQVQVHGSYSGTTFVATLVIVL